MLNPEWFYARVISSTDPHRAVYIPKPTALFYHWDKQTHVDILAGNRLYHGQFSDSWGGGRSLRLRLPKPLIDACGLEKGMWLKATVLDNGTKLLLTKHIGQQKVEFKARVRIGPSNSYKIAVPADICHVHQLKRESIYEITDRSGMCRYKSRSYVRDTAYLILALRAELRDRLNLKPDSILNVTLHDNRRFVIEKVTPLTTPHSNLLGA